MIKLMDGLKLLSIVYRLEGERTGQRKGLKLEGIGGNVEKP